MPFRCWFKAKRRAISCQLLAFACLLTAASCPAQVPGSSAQSNQTQTTVPSLEAQEAPSGITKMHVVSSVPLPEFWKKMGNSDRVACSRDGDLLFELIPGEPADMPHEVARVAANGAMLGYFDLRQIPGFEKGTIRQATFDSEGRIVLLVANLIRVQVMRTDADGRPRSTRFGVDHTHWVLTVDDSGKVLSKFSFRDSVVTGQNIALFKNRNVLVTGSVGESAIVFSPDGAILAKVKVPALENQNQLAAASDERAATPPPTPVQASGSAPGADAPAAMVRRPPMAATILVPIAGDGDEIYLVPRRDERFLLKVSADGTLGPKVKLTIPEDERAHVEEIAGHRALVLISSAQRLPPGTTIKTPEWSPIAVFDTESGTLIETLLVSTHESGPVCYSGSGMKAIRIPEGTLDTLEK